MHDFVGRGDVKAKGAACLVMAVAVALAISCISGETAYAGPVEQAASGPQIDAACAVADSGGGVADPGNAGGNAASASGEAADAQAGFEGLEPGVVAHGQMGDDAAPMDAAGGGAVDNADAMPDADATDAAAESSVQDEGGRQASAAADAAKDPVPGGAQRVVRPAASGTQAVASTQGPAAAASPQPGADAATKAATPAKAVSTQSASASSTVAAQSAGKLLPAGAYVFVAGTARGKVLDVCGASTKAGANVIIWNYNGGANQKWTVSYASDGYAIIKGIGGNVLEVAGTKPKSGLNIRMGAPRNTANQKWKVVKNADGTMSFTSALGKFRLDITGQSGKNGTNVELWSENTTKAQKWTVQPLKPSIPKSATVANGWYTLRSSLDKDYYLDVTGCAANNGTQLELWTKNTSTAQAFRIYREGQFYRIESGVGSGFNLDIAGGAVVPGTKGEIWRSTTNCALYSLVRNSDGSYRLVNVASGLALAASSGRAFNGSAVNGELSVANGRAQSFFLQAQHGIVSEGVYTLRTVLSGNRAMGARGASSAAGGKMAISSYTASFHQKWQLAAVKGQSNTFTLESIDTGLKLQGASKKDASQARPGSSSVQWWRPEGAGGDYRLRNVATNQLLDVSGASGNEGTAVLCWPSNGGANQRWRLARVPAIESGIYEFCNGANRGLALDVTGASQDDGANIEAWSRNNGANQRWYYNASEGTLVSMSSGKALDVANASAKSGANVIQYKLNGGINQKWTIAYAGGGMFRICSKLGGSLVLSADSGASGKNVANAVNVAAARQAWKPVKHDLGLSAAMKRNLSGVNMTNIRGVGIDVSSWQGTINWGAAKNAGVNFAMIRIGHGISIADAQLANNVRGCIAYNIPFGLYYYSTAKNVNQAKVEANHALKLMRGAGVTKSNASHGVFLDLEEDSMGKTGNRRVLVDIASTFLDSVQAQGYKPGVYANLSWWNNYLTDPAFNKWQRWVAQWRVARPTYGGSYKFWQTSTSGSVPGISGAVDIDVMY